MCQPSQVVLCTFTRLRLGCMEKRSPQEFMCRDKCVSGPFHCALPSMGLGCTDNKVGVFFRTECIVDTKDDPNIAKGTFIKLGCLNDSFRDIFYPAL